MRIKLKPGMPIRRGEARLDSAAGISTARERKRSRGAFARALAALVPMVAALITGAATRVFPGEPSPPLGKNPPNVAVKPKSAAAPFSSTLAASVERVPLHLSLHEQIDRLIEAKLAKELPGQAPAAPATDAEFSAACLARPGRHDPDGRRGPGLPRRSLALQAAGARSIACWKARASPGECNRSSTSC